MVGFWLSTPRTPRSTMQVGGKPAGPGQLELIVRAGPDAGRTIPLQAAVMTVGRDPAVDITLDDAKLSRHHARLEPRPEGVVLVDLQSTNGTFVNGQRALQPTLLRVGDELVL